LCIILLVENVAIEKNVEFMVFRVVLFQMVGGYQHFGGPVLNAEGRGSMIL
jgi:hypothetical protein